MVAKREFRGVMKNPQTRAVTAFEARRGGYGGLYPYPIRKQFILYIYREGEITPITPLKTRKPASLLRFGVCGNSPLTPPPKGEI